MSTTWPFGQKARVYNLPLIRSLTIKIDITKFYLVCCPSCTHPFLSLDS